MAAHKQQVSSLLQDLYKSAPLGHTSGAPSPAASLLLRLINDTFVSVPVSGCWREPPLAGQRHQPAKAGASDLCSVAWSRSSVLRGLMEAELAELTLLRSPAEASGPANCSVAQPAAGSCAAEWLHWSADAGLSLAGLLVNLLIVVIVVINAKQRISTHSLLSRGGHSGLHHILLAQLALAGLLLAGRSLVANLEALQPRQARTGHEPQLVASPMATFLAPLRPRPHCAAGGAESRPPEPSFGLLLTFHQAAKTEPGARTSANADRSPRSCYLKVESAPDAPGALYDLSQVLESLDLVALTSGRGPGLGGERPEPPAPSKLDLLTNLVGSIHIWTVTLLTYDRYCAIAHPLQYLRSTGAIKTRLLLVFTWIISLLLNLVLPICLETAVGKTALNVTAPSGAQLGTVVDWPQRFDETSASSWLEDGNVSCQRKSPSDEELIPILMTGFSARFHAARLALADQDYHGDEDQRRAMYTRLLDTSLTCLSFLLLILAPLVMVTVCNISIYQIVKIHERRLSTSSSSQGAISQASSHYYHNHNHHHYNQWSHSRHKCDFDDKSDTTSVASSILSKLVRASTQVALLRSFKRPSEHCTHASHSVCDHSEAYNLIDEVPSAETRTRLSEDNRLSGGGQYITEGQARNEPIVSYDGQQTIVNRSRRLAGSLSRRDYYQLIGGKEDGQGQTGATQAAPHAGRPRQQLKRKWSDQPSEARQVDSCLICSTRRPSVGPGSPRKYSSVSDGDHHCRHQAPASGPMIDPEVAADNCCATCRWQLEAGVGGAQQAGPRCAKTPQDSVRIMHQLKMAGLSFAGIALTSDDLIASSANGHSSVAAGRQQQRHLHRSSSCSLGSLGSSSANMAPVGRSNAIQRQHSLASDHCPLIRQSQQQRPRLIRGSASSSNLIAAQASACVRSPLVQTTERNCFSEHANNLARHSDNNDHHHQRYAEIESQLGTHSTGRLPGASLGTKSAIFNAIIWLTLTMLLLALSQNFINIIEQITSSLNDAPKRARESLQTDSSEYRKVEQILQNIMGDLAHPGDLSQADATAGWRDMIYLWIRGANRLLFLLMLSLNAWLYGIRSRTLKTTLKMILRRYISKKQASIEIDQRQKSNTASMRSRDSSFVSLPHYFFAHPTPTTSSPSHQNEFAVHRTTLRLFRRCTSLNMPSSGSNRYEDQARDPLERHRCLEKNGSNNDENFSETASIRCHNAESKVDVERDNCKLQANKTKLHSNSIRFTVDDLNNSKPLVGQLNLGHVTNSLPSSMMGSHRSLLSASIQSSQSAAYLLLDQKQMDLSIVMGETICKPMPHGVLKKRTTAIEPSNQESNDITGSVCIGRKGRLMVDQTFGRQYSFDIKDDDADESVVSRAPNILPISHSSCDTNTSIKCQRTGEDSQRSQRSTGSQAEKSLRKSSSEIKFLLTSEDHPSESRVLDINLSQKSHDFGDENNNRAEVSASTPSPHKQIMTQLVDHAEVETVTIRATACEPARWKAQQTRSTSWFKQLKQSLARCITDGITASRRALANSLDANSTQSSGVWFPESPCSCATTSPLVDADARPSEVNITGASHSLDGESSPCSEFGDNHKRNSSNQVEKNDHHKKSSDSAHGSRRLFRKYSDSLASTSATDKCYPRAPNVDQLHTNRTLLLRKSSLDSNASGLFESWRNHDGHHQLDSEIFNSDGKDPPASGVRTPMRNSVTIGNLAINKSGCRRAHHHNQRHHQYQSIACKPCFSLSSCNHHHNHHQAIDRTPSASSNALNRTDQSQVNGDVSTSVHLKPPNFLKLIFDPDTHNVNAMFASQLALSPIKECSSNHSYASSQSSLVNNQAMQIKIQNHLNLQHQNHRQQTCDKEGNERESAN